MPPRDSDIFGDEQEAGKDVDIFVDVEPEKKEKPEVKAEAPSLSYTDRMKRGGMEMLRGLATGGPGGAIVAGGREGLRNLDEIVDQVATDVGGGVTDLASGVVSPETAAKIGFGSNVAVRAIPAVLGGEVAKLASPAFQSNARTWMQSALKPSWEAISKGKASQAIETMLKDGVSVTEGGLVKLKTEIGKLGDEVKSLIAASPETINPGNVGKSLVHAYNKLLESANPSAGIEALKKAWGEFRSHPLMAAHGDQVPVQVAQRIKQGTNRQLGDAAYGIGLKPAAEKDSLKAIVHGLKEEIANVVPGVAPLNQRMSELLNVTGLLERRVGVDANKALLGLTPLGANPLSWALFMADRMPGLKSLAARGLYSGAEQIPATAARAGIGHQMMPPEDQRGALYDVWQ